jgi:hypothetical protein
MKRTFATIALLASTLSASAQGIPQMIGNDPLAIQIRMKVAEQDFGIKSVVGVGEKNVAVPLTMAAAMTTPAETLKTAAPLKARKRKVSKEGPSRNALHQLRKVAAKKAAL